MYRNGAKIHRPHKDTTFDRAKHSTTLTQKGFWETTFKKYKEISTLVRTSGGIYLLS